MIDGPSVENVERQESRVPEVSRRVRAKIYSGFDDLPVSYLHLFEEGPSRSFDSILPWFQNLHRKSLEGNSGVRIYGLEVGDQERTAVAALPARHELRPRSWFKPTTLFGLSNYYSSVFGPALHPDFPRSELLQGLATAICSDTPRWDTVNLRPLAIDSEDFSCLIESFHRCGWLTQTYFCFGNWYLPVGGRTYKEYFQSLPAAVQNTVKRKSKKLERSGQARFELVTKDERLDEAIRDYTTVYKASWKVPEPHPEFIPSLIRMCAAMGWLRLGLVYVGDVPAAAQLWIVKDGVASIYKLAYDEQFAALSVGSYLTTRLMEHAIDVDRVHEVDYLTGDDPYKKDWMSHRRERWGILAMNPRTVGGILSAIRHVGGRTLKRAVRRMAGKASEGGPDLMSRQERGPGTRLES
jgi:GNAT acetyltransferase-like protein